MAIGDVSEMPGDERSPGNTSDGDDGGGEGRERDAGVVGGLRRTE
jgi:hypothetical protein